MTKLEQTIKLISGLVREDLMSGKIDREQIVKIAHRINVVYTTEVHGE